MVYQWVCKCAGRMLSRSWVRSSIRFFGLLSRYFGLVATLSTSARSALLRLFAGTWRGPALRSSPIASRRQRCTVRTSSPTSSHAACWLAPAVRASSSRPRILSRSSCWCRRPRPPRFPGLFFSAIRAANSASALSLRFSSRLRAASSFASGLCRPDLAFAASDNPAFASNPHLASVASCRPC